MTTPRRIARGGTAEIWATPSAPDRVYKLARRRRGADAALASEAAALAALADTGVAPRHRTDDLGGRPALVLERLDGPSLARWRPTGVRAALSLAAALADQVATLHDAGWVHGDLSPANVIVVDADRAPRPRLIDFGAATTIGAPTPPLLTRAYAAPERLAPTPATAAQDVYALGAITHRLITGRAPFVDGGRVATLAHRDRRVPSAAAWIDDDGATALRAALHKDPARRPTARALAQALGRATPRQRTTTPRPATERAPRLARGTRPPPTARVGSPGLFGRHDELELLVEALRTPDRPRLITVLAEAGLGKSALLAEVRARAPIAVCALDGGHPLGDLIALAGPPADADDRAALAHLVDGGPAPRCAMAPGALRLAASRALAAGLATHAAILVDDAHAADPLLLDAIERLLAGPWRGVVIVAARPALHQTRPRWGQRVEVSTTVTLTPLTPPAGRALARALMPELLAVADRALDQLVERAGGSPLLLGELIGLARATGRLGIDRDGVATLATDRLVATIDGDLLADATAATLARLPDDLVAMARALAVIGPLPRALLCEILDDDELALPLDAEVALGRLGRAGLTRADDDTRFRHDLVRDAVAATVPPALAAVIHAAVVRRGDRLELATRLHHLTGAEADAEATLAEGWRALAEDAERRHDYLTAERAAGAALARGGDPIGLRRLRGRARARLGHHAAALEDLDAAAAQTFGAVRAHLRLEAATALDWLNRYRDAERVTDEAAVAAGPSPEPDLAAALAMARGRAAWRRRDAATAIVELEAALTAAAPLPLAKRYELELAARIMLGWILPGVGASDDAAHHLEVAATLAGDHGDELHLTAVENNRYALHAARGDEAAARAALARFTELARQLGLDAAEYRGHHGQAIVAWWCEDDRAAARHAAAALRFERAAPSRFKRPRAALLCAALAVGRGDRDDAAAHAATARAALDRATDEVGAAGDRLTLTALELALTETLDRASVAPLAQTALAAGDPELAFELIELAARAAAVGHRADHATALSRWARAISPALPKLITRRRARWEATHA